MARYVAECTRCLYTTDFPGVVMSEDGTCNSCKQHDELEKIYPSGYEGQACFEEVVEEIKAARRGTFDCVVGVSGGTDSSYMLMRCVKAGLRCLAVHADNSWNTDFAMKNIIIMTRALKVPLEVAPVNPDEYDDIVKAFIKAEVADIEAPADIGLAKVLYATAEKYRIKYIMEGHSFRTEGISPVGQLYFDAKYVMDVHAKFGTMPMESYSPYTLWDMIRCQAIKRIKKIRPLVWMDYNKDGVKRLLGKEYGWINYDGHHCENKLTAFYHDVWIPAVCGINTRIMGWAAEVRSGQMSKADGKKRLEEEQNVSDEIIEEVRERLFDGKEGQLPFPAVLKTYMAYRTYKRTFELTKPFWWTLVKFGLMTESFMKYCEKR